MTTQIWLDNLAAYSLQVAVLVVAGTALITAARIKAPQVLLAFWQALLVLCLLLPALQPWAAGGHWLPGSSSFTGQEVTDSGTTPAQDATQAGATAVSWRDFIPGYRTVAWLLAAGAGLKLLWLALGLLRLRRYRDRSRLLSDLSEPLRDLQRRVAVKPDIFLSPEIDTPVTFGWRRPAVLFPKSFPELGEQWQRPIACHEFVHVRRRDWAFMAIEEVLRSLFWFHPAVWWLLGRIHLCREQVVDRAVLKITGERDSYLESLLHFASMRGRPAAVPAPLLLRERHLVQRVALMLKENKMNRTRLIVSLAAVVALLLWAGTLAAAWFPLAGPPAPPGPVMETVTPHPGPAENPVSVAAPVPSQPEAAAPAAPAKAPAKVPQQKIEPLRVGGNVQESKLIKRVEPVYPEIAKQTGVSGIVMLEVLVNEEGMVENVRVIRGYPLLDQAAIDAVRQWRYAPTTLNGVAVPVIAIQTVVFNPNGSSSTGKFVTPMEVPNMASAVLLDPAGNLVDREGNPVSLEDLQKGTPVIQVPPGTEVPFEILERTLRNLQAQGIRNFRIAAPGYRFAAGRLFYYTRTLAANVGGRTFPDIEPPVLELDTESLAAMAAGKTSMLGYIVYVDQTGQIVSVEAIAGLEDIPEVVTALSQTRVLSPGRRNGQPVPVAVAIAIPVRKQVE